jgi:hypothetical protein
MSLSVIFARTSLIPLKIYGILCGLYMLLDPIRHDLIRSINNVKQKDIICTIIYTLKLLQMECVEQGTRDCR